MSYHSFLGCFLILFLVVSRGGRCEAGEANTNGGRIVCYVTRTSYMPVTDIPDRLCTHIIVAFAEIKGLMMAALSSKDEMFYNGVTKLKFTNPALSVLISLQRDFTDVILATDQQKQDFALDLYNYVKKYNFDGVDFDWEPNQVTPEKKQGYMKIIQIVRSTFDNETSVLGTAPKQMSAALIPSIPRSRMYDIPGLAKVLDFATAMTYDYHMYIHNVDSTTAYNSPLYAPVGERKDYCADGTIKNYLNLGMPASKLLLGLPTYGRTYTLGEADSHSLHSPAVGKGKPGPVRKLSGLYTYQDACTVLKGSTRVWDDQSSVPYLYSGTTWASYEDQESSSKKCQYVVNNRLGGVGIWALHLDDYNNMCGQKVFPLVRAVGSCLTKGRSAYLKYQPLSNIMTNDGHKFGYV
ncbi:chitotriosidase-1-like isoform X2 [Pecten maximus]|uniref:chitotriosidase-1-like isoform X2 n=1 Tax=Pecten maximus TaxID=6579 RepID=UPI001457F90A|nr:chitotriosidase-1-like isoform X2 [Pecten maximus]